MSTPPSRGMWSSRAGFILAAAGSAVGLGNIWGFPTQVGQGGGAAFVVVYLACIFLICAPIMAGEIALGRRTRQSPVGSFAALAPGRRWWLVGGLGVLAGVGILSFYSVIAGWAVAYVWFVATGAVSGSPDEIGRFFSEFTGNGLVSAALAFFVIGTTAAVLLGGVRSGIERVTKALMPLLVLLLIALAVRAVTLPGAGAGLAYYLSPDLARLADVGVFTSALGQAFFSLSLGMGCILTYGSYFSRQDGIAASALWIVALDTSIALLAGFIIFPVGFSIAGFDPTASGPGLIFTVLSAPLRGVPRRSALRRSVLPLAQRRGAYFHHLPAGGSRVALRRRPGLVAGEGGRRGDRHRLRSGDPVGAGQRRGRRLHQRAGIRHRFPRSDGERLERVRPADRRMPHGNLHRPHLGGRARARGATGGRSVVSRAGPVGLSDPLDLPRRHRLDSHRHPGVDAVTRRRRHSIGA